MDSTTSNIVQLFAHRRLSSIDRRGHGEGSAESDSSNSMLDRLQLQDSALEKAIFDIEAARDRVELSAAGADAALRKFEQTLSNLRLSLSNQRRVSVVIRDAAAAGEAAARVKALVLTAGSSAITVLRHDFVDEHQGESGSNSDEVGLPTRVITT